MIMLPALVLADPEQPSAQAAVGASPCAIKSDTVVAAGGVGASWIGWESQCLPNADLVYVDRDSWELWVMDENGGHKRCLTCKGSNVLGGNFPLDEDGKDPEINWKGDPEAHPSQPIIIFKAENEHSRHLQLINAPSIGWANDLWALNVCSKRYTRLTRLKFNEGLQHSAVSEDGRWYVYPRRYARGRALKHFGLAAMVFAEMTIDQRGDLQLKTRFEATPNGEMYYEPHDVRPLGNGEYILLYTAGSGLMFDPYSYRWHCRRPPCSGDNQRLLETPDTHEEFTMYSPSGERIVWMRGPQVGLGYRADLYVSRPDLSEAQRLTYFNDCKQWPDRCKKDGAQLSRLEWKDDGTAVFYGLWLHGGRFGLGHAAELHRLDFTGPCGTSPQ
jgi:hypothetical protein